jgi:L-ascorbate oxidase
MLFPSAAGLLLATAQLVSGHKPGSPLAAPGNGSHLRTHGGDFVPDFFLSVTYENHTVACQRHMSVLVNRTSPGPTLRLPAGKTSWVRVCNDMDNYNTTMVSTLSSTANNLVFAADLS